MSFSRTGRANFQGGTFYDVMGNQVVNTYVSPPGNTEDIPASTSSAALNTRESEVYARILLPRGHGYPLWHPEPLSDLPRQYRRKGVNIGDVGIITADGAFDFLFNICLPSNHRINAGRVPPGFIPLKLKNRRDVARFPDMHQPGRAIASNSITMESEYAGTRMEIGEEGHYHSGASMNINFECSPREGALLILPDGASRSKLRPLKIFQEYAKTHARAWYNFVNGQLNRMVSNGSLYLVTGIDKTRSWGVASYSDISGRTVISLKVTPSSDDRPYAWERSGQIAARAGPRRTVHHQNQCVFIRGFKVAVRENAVASMLRGQVKLSHTVHSDPSEILDKDPSIPGTSKSSSLGTFFGWKEESSGASGSMGHTESPEVMTELFPSMPDPYHPSVAINDYLLNTNPDANVAIIHDDIWINVMKEEDEHVPDSVELLRRILEEHHVVHETGSVFLELNIRPAAEILDGTEPPECQRSTVSSTESILDSHSASDDLALDISTSPSLVTSSECSEPEMEVDDQIVDSLRSHTDPVTFDAALRDSRISRSTAIARESPPSSFSPYTPILPINSLVSAPRIAGNSPHVYGTPPIILTPDSHYLHFPSELTDSLVHMPNTSKTQQTPLNRAASLWWDVQGDPNNQPVLPQVMYKPHTQSDRRRYVEEVDLEGPIYFRTKDGLGIPLRDVLHSRVKRLFQPDETVFHGRGPSVSIRLEWPGYGPWSKQIPTKDFTDPPVPVTRAKLAKNIAKCVYRFIDEHKGRNMMDDAHRRWKVGENVKLEDLVLLSLHHVSMGSWQPQLKIRKPAHLV